MWLYHAVTAVPGVPVVVIRWGPTVIWQRLHVSPALCAHLSFSFPYPFISLPSVPFWPLCTPPPPPPTTAGHSWSLWSSSAADKGCPIALHKATRVEAYAVLINAGRLPSTQILSMRLWGCHHAHNFKDSRTITTICSVLLYLQMVTEWVLN